jgi:hypothetical protein
MNADWLEKLRESDPEAAAIIDEEHRLEAIGWEVLKREGRLHPTPVGFGASWKECYDAGLQAESETQP